MGEKETQLGGQLDKHPSIRICPHVRPKGTCPAMRKSHVSDRPLPATGVWRRARFCGTLSLEKIETQKLRASVHSAAQAYTCQPQVALAIHKLNADIGKSHVS